MHGNTFFLMPYMFDMSGDMHSRTLKILCKECNSGWVSKIENDAKPIIIDLPEVQGHIHKIMDKFEPELLRLFPFTDAPLNAQIPLDDNNF